MRAIKTTKKSGRYTEGAKIYHEILIDLNIHSEESDGDKHTSVFYEMFSTLENFNLFTH